jgi:GTPase SAR1 family protein
MSIQELKSGIEKLISITGLLSDTHFKSMADELGARIDFPSPWATFIGETSTGKSTLINSFLGERLLPTGVSPTSGSIVQLVFTAPDDTRNGDVYRKRTADMAGTIREEDILRDGFIAQCRNPSSDLKCLQVFTGRKGTRWNGFQIFDTPGYNSLIESHGEVLTRFLPRCDVIVMVVSHRTGFGQVDQQLFETVYESLRDLTVPPPVILVINRTPEGVGLDGKRVKEIVARASDCLHWKFDCLTVESVMPPDDGSFIPLETDTLFEKIFEHTLSAEAERKTQATIRATMLNVCDEALQSLCHEREGLMAKIESINGLSERIKYLEKIKEGCYSVIDTFFNDLETSCSTLIKGEINQTKDTVHREVDCANKWVDANECANYMSAHIVPFGVKQAIASLREHIRYRMSDLNKELKDYMNAASSDFMAGPGPDAPDATDLVKDILGSIAKTIGTKLTSEAIAELAGGIGWQVTSSAFTPGVAQMAGGFSSYLGSFGKILPEVVMRNLSIVLIPLVDVILSIKDAFTWQSQLKEKMDNALDTQLDPDVDDGLMGQMINHVSGLRDVNIRKVPELLGQEITLLQSSLDDPSDPNEQIRKIEAISDELTNIRASIAKEH